MATEVQPLVEFMSEATPAEENEGKWLLHLDGSSTYAGNGARLVLTSLEEDKLEFSLRFDFKASNKKVKYEAIKVGIRMALDARVRNLTAYSDSQLMTKQVERT
ncbi:UNVERIFIED_CONTAM: hypothetical protein Sradi_5717500 [Sesamum radiatum]|uniref:RNase H type-1 domain-containing protein n=1 Tax=Sesamum radiatum TaxID=300843 RepID=A0AAW2L3F4_SESRA